jgi:hypothetical protein
MSIQAVLLPVFVLVALAFGLLLSLGRTRVGALRRREVRLSDVALGENAWPKRVTQIGRAYQNQLEVPLFFYVLVALALITHKAGFGFVLLSWVFVALRLAHAYVHVTSNVVRYRFNLFAAGVTVLVIMWISFAIQVLTSP